MIVSSLAVAKGLTGMLRTTPRHIQTTRCSSNLLGGRLLTGRHRSDISRNRLLFSSAADFDFDSDKLFENVISSTKSNTVKKAQNLLNKRKKRQEYGKTIVEGPRMVFDLLRNPQTASLVQQVLVSEEDFEDIYRHRLLPFASSCHVQLVTPAVLKACSDTVTPQGIVAVVDIPSPESFSTDLKDSQTIAPFHLVLDGVSDPGNVGTLLRSSLAVGVASVILLPGSCDVWNPKAVRSAMGASFQLPIFDCCSWEDAREKLSENHCTSVYAATMMESTPPEGSDSGPSQNGSHVHYNIDWLAGASALVIGSEGTGLSMDVRDALTSPVLSDRINAVHVPMQAGIESLNAAVCGSVIMFEYARQCQQSESKPGIG